MIDLSTLLPRLQGRATFLHDRGEVKSPELMDEAITALKALEAENEYRLSFLHIQDKRIAEIEAENRAMREALEQIVAGALPITTAKIALKQETNDGLRTQ